MARTIAAIQQTIIDAKQADPVLAGLSSTSGVSVWRLWTYIIAACHWALEQLMDQHTAEVQRLLEAQRPHTRQWYVHKAKLFQFGSALPLEQDVYEPIITDRSIRIVHYAACVELAGSLRIKVATTGTVGLAPLLPEQLLALQQYMQRVKDAGVRLEVTSGMPDTLQLELVIYYHPLIMNALGERLDGTVGKGVKEAIKAYLINLPFNGMLVLNNLRHVLQQVEGVTIGHIAHARARHASLAFSDIDITYTPDSGYMALDEGHFATHITYIAHSHI